MVALAKSICLSVVLMTLAANVNASCFEALWKRGKPYNYYANETRVSTSTYRGGLLYLVESRHFTSSVLNLTKGSTSRLPGDLIFVLNTIPNHPSALDAYSRYEYRYRTSEAFREDRDNQRPAYSADCLFERAVRVFPGNAETFIAWGIHHYRNSDTNSAKKTFLQALELSPNNVEAHYNLGLVYVDLGQIELARKHATIAYEAGYPLPGLRQKIDGFAQK